MVHFSTVQYITLKLQLRHLRLSHAHLLNTEDLSPLAHEDPERIIRVHLGVDEKGRKKKIEFKNDSNVDGHIDGSGDNKNKNNNKKNINNSQNKIDDSDYNDSSDDHNDYHN